MRIRNAEEKANGNNEKFVNAMVSRLKKITHKDKVMYAIEVLKHLDHNDVVDIYEGRLLMEEFLKAQGQVTYK
jgi:hypothetical protein